MPLVMIGHVFLEKILGACSLVLRNTLRGFCGGLGGVGIFEVRGQACSIHQSFFFELLVVAERGWGIRLVDF